MDAGFEIITEKDEKGNVVKATVKMNEKLKPKKVINNPKTNDKL